MSKNSKRAASLKGWRTRRANERKRSEAAKKGWLTRRANEQRAGRKEINSIEEWNDLNFSDTEDIEVVSNADY